MGLDAAASRRAGVGRQLAAFQPHQHAQQQDAKRSKVFRSDFMNFIIFRCFHVWVLV